jgi:hypothetical protein
MHEQEVKIPVPLPLSEVACWIFCNIHLALEGPTLDVVCHDSKQPVLRDAERRK